MKNLFNIIVIAIAFVIAFAIYQFYFGSQDNFQDSEKKKPKAGNVVAMIYTGGPIVAVLMCLIIVAITFVVERFLSIGKANGKGNIGIFVKKVQDQLSKGAFDEALSECKKQRGSLANIIRAAVESFKQNENASDMNNEQKMSEVQRAIDEATNLETPLLEKNLVILSTVASISTMFGLLGTCIGMIRAFAALGDAGGSVDATALAIGISEALYNTAGGLLCAIISIVAFNFMSTKVDNYVYKIDESILNVTQIFKVRLNK